MLLNKNLLQDPHLLVLPSLLFCCCLGLGLFAVLFSSANEQRSSRDTANGVCNSAVSDLLAKLAIANGPAMTIQSLARTSPRKEDFEKAWAAAAMESVDQVGKSTLAHATRQTCTWRMPCCADGGVVGVAGCCSAQCCCTVAMHGHATVLLHLMPI